MKIIQSFAKLNVGNVYLDKLNKYDNDFKIGSETYLLFYSFLLSYLTLKKYCGSVTMYCNRDAYESFIKYIPYDEIILKENKYDSLKFWSVYKIDVIEEQTEDFIHVDSDVFIFDDIFRPFINNSNYDLIVQNIFDIDIINKDKWMYNICPIEKFDNKSFLCGVIGFNNITHKDKYIENTIKVKKLIEDNLVVGNPVFTIEELTLYLTKINYDLTYYDILPYEDIKQSIHKSGEKNKYTHMWFSSKYTKENIELIKNKIKIDFPEYYQIVENYDNYISIFDIKYLSERN